VTLFAWNLALALVWAAVLGEFSAGSLAAGFAIGFAILGVAGRLFGSSRYVEKSLRLAEFVAFFVAQLVISSLRVAADVVTPRHRARPGIVAVPLDARTDGEITLLSNLVSLTPGSLTLDVSDDRRTLFVHVMFLDDVEACRREIKDGFERRVLELLR
jgi:multicomponent Na+:H+ antiporter subunit E